MVVASSSTVVGAAVVDVRFMVSAATSLALLSTTATVELVAAFLPRPSSLLGSMTGCLGGGAAGVRSREGVAPSRRRRNMRRRPDRMRLPLVAAAVECLMPPFAAVPAELLEAGPPAVAAPFFLLPFRPPGLLRWRLNKMALQKWLLTAAVVDRAW